MASRENFSESCYIKPIWIVITIFPVNLGSTEQNSAMWQINRRSENAIQIWFNLTRFIKYLFGCNLQRSRKVVRNCVPRIPFKYRLVAVWPKLRPFNLGQTATVRPNIMLDMRNAYWFSVRYLILLYKYICIYISWPDDSPADNSPADNLPTDNSPNGQFAQRTFRQRIISPTDNSPINIAFS